MLGLPFFNHLPLWLNIRQLSENMTRLMDFDSNTEDMPLIPMSTS